MWAIFGATIIGGMKVANAAQANSAGLPYSVLIVAGQSNAAGAESLVVDPQNNIDVFGAQTVQPADSQVQMRFDNGWNNSDSRINPVPLSTLQADPNQPATFGPEVGLSRRLYELGRRRIVILKVTVASTPLASDPNNSFDWNINSTNEGYQRLKDRASTLFSDIESQGATYSVDGFYWVQGEDDAHNTNFANQYEQNLRDFIDAARTDLGMAPNAPFVIGQTDVSEANEVVYGGSDPNCQTQPCIDAEANNSTVREAQAAVASDTPNVEIVDTAPMPRTGLKIHLSNVGQLELGTQFANITESLQNGKLPLQDSSIVESASEWDKVYNRSRPQLMRDGGSSIRLGDKILWMFGDTLFVDESVDGTHARSTTAALAPINDPHNLTEPLDAYGAPSQFIPFSAEEEAWNVAHRENEPNNRWVKWPTDAVNTSPTEGYVFYRHLRSTFPNNQITVNQVGIGLAKVTQNSTTATVINEALFNENEPHYTPTVSKDGILYLSSCEGINGQSFDHQCSTARVTLEQITNRNAYQFWNGSEWSLDINSAVKDPRNSQGKIIWSEYLQKYVQFYYRGFSGSIMMRTAASPEGPWSNGEFVHAIKGSEYVSILYAHPDLTMDDERTIVLSFNKNNPADGIHTLKVTFSAAADARIKPAAPKTGKLIGVIALVISSVGLIIWAAKEVDSKKRVSAKSNK